MVKIVSVGEHSRAARAGICPGDVLHTINGREINDVLDYRFHLANRTITLCVARDEQLLEITITKGEYDDIGLEFSQAIVSVHGIPALPACERAGNVIPKDIDLAIV